jgi:hypothetical protein
LTLDEIDASKIDRNHPCHSKRLQSTYYPAGLIKTNQPIIGILTQPYGYGANNIETANYSSTDLEDSYIPTAHVAFLEAAGARVAPVNYRLSYNALIDLLRSINGIYIPGDSIMILSNLKFMQTVENIYEYAQN